MFKTNQPNRIIVWITVVFLFPLPFVATYLLGTTSNGPVQKLGVVYGIVAYAWLLLNLYVTTKPRWLNSFVSRKLATGMSQMLSMVAILFAGFHKNLSPTFGLAEQTGQVAMMVLVSGALYWVLLSTNGLSRLVPTLSLIHI